ncbi:hypothetical protein ACOBV8_20865 (plasmid) [Pseudoalteromonas espejiana]
MKGFKTRLCVSSFYTRPILKIPRQHDEQTIQEARLIYVFKFDWRILTVGDGDLSFSNALHAHIKPSKLVAST